MIWHTIWIYFHLKHLNSFKHTQRDITGFRFRKRVAAEKVKPGDKLICYMTKLSRWCALLEVLEGPYHDDTPRYADQDDPFVIRFKINTLVLLDKIQKSGVRFPLLVSMTLALADGPVKSAKVS